MQRSKECDMVPKIGLTGATPRWKAARSRCRCCLPANQDNAPKQGNRAEQSGGVNRMLGGSE
jgi:hypothetical protein